jgi:hypothetical protein
VNTGTWQLIKSVDLPAGSSAMSTVRIQELKGFKVEALGLR